MKTILTAAVILFASTAHGQVPIAFETIVDLDSFRVINRSIESRILEIFLRPPQPGYTARSVIFDADDDMDAPFPSHSIGNNWTRWLFPGGFDRDDWAEFAGPTDSTAALEVRFGWVSQNGTPRITSLYTDGLASGTFSGVMVPEPGTWVIACVSALVCAGVLVKRRRALASSNTTPCTPPI